MLLTDDGSENYGEVIQWITGSDAPKIRHVIAQVDIHYSNSMIEAANKQLKYRFLYHQKINNFPNLENYLSKAILDFNHRPHGVLNGLSPMEVLQGKTYNKENQNNLLSLSVQRRISENQQLKCFMGSLKTKCFFCVGKVEALLQILLCFRRCTTCKCAYTCALAILIYETFIFCLSLFGGLCVFFVCRM